jgi:predicted outer membrane repeat protein
MRHVHVKRALTRTDPVKPGRKSGALVGGLAMALWAVGGSVILAEPAAASTILYAYPSGGATAGPCPQTSTPADQCNLTVALQLAQPGDTVALAGQVYGAATVSTAGTSATARVTIEPAPGVTDPVLSGPPPCTGITTCEVVPVLTIGSGVFAAVSGVTIENGFDRNDFAGGGLGALGGANVTVTASTFSDNSATGFPSQQEPAFGGAMAISAGATVTVTSSTFTANSATASGGAIYDSGGTLDVSSSTFSGNTAAGGGGAIENDGGTVTVTGSTFTDNSATASGGEGGGAIDNGYNGTGGTVTVGSSTFTDNSTGGYGGAISDGDAGGYGTVTVTGSTFTANSATGGALVSGGGAIANGDTGSGTLTVTGSTFSGNSAIASGGAIDNGYNSGSGTLTVTTSSFSGNSATGAPQPVGGGAIDNQGTATVTGSTFSANSTAGAGGAVLGNVLNVTSSTFSANSSGGDGGALDILTSLKVTFSTFSGNSTGGVGGAIMQEPNVGGGKEVDTVAADIFNGDCVGVDPGSVDWVDLGYNVGSDTSCLSGITSYFPQTGPPRGTWTPARRCRAWSGRRRPMGARP